MLAPRDWVAKEILLWISVIEETIVVGGEDVEDNEIEYEIQTRILFFLIFWLGC